MKLPRKWSKIGHVLLLAGMIGLLLDWMVLSIVFAFGGLALLKWKCKCPYCGRWSAPPWPWSEDAVRFFPHCGNRLEYDDT